MTDAGLLAEAILVLGFAFGFTVVGYEEHAAMRGWAVGEWFTGVGFVKVFGFMVTLGAILLSLIVTPWWFVFVTLVGGFLIGFVLSELFRSWAQVIALAGSAVCFLAAPFFVT